MLLKQDRLNAREREIIQSHTIIGADILSGSRFELLQLAEEIALSHHERWDGLGYPHGLAREKIPLAGRIVAVADVFDALTHDRPYKNAWTPREALTEIEAQSGSQFDPSVVEALLRIAPEMRVLETHVEADEALPRSGHLVTAPPTAAPDAATMATLRLLEEERDELARELAELRQQVMPQEPTGVQQVPGIVQQVQKVVRIRRWTQPN